MSLRNVVRRHLNLPGKVGLRFMKTVEWPPCVRLIPANTCLLISTGTRNIGCRESYFLARQASVYKVAMRHIYQYQHDRSH